ncbi:MAG TPA: hypothetical protein VIG24_12010 [Acidimicrobiia bacterium]
MGLLKGKKKHQLHTQVQRVVDDHELPETVKTSVIRAIMADRENASIPEYLINGFANTIALKADRLMNYAGEHYSYGLPRSDLATKHQGQDIVQYVIEAELGHPITVDDYEFTSINSLHLGWMRLIQDYGYDTATNELTVLSASQGRPVYLHDMVAVFTEASFAERDLNAFAQWGMAARAGYTPERPTGTSIGQYKSRSALIVDEAATEDSVEITYIYQDETGANIKDTLTLSMEGFEEDIEYYHVRYHYTDTSGPTPVERLGFWLYRNGAHTYPDGTVSQWPYDAGDEATPVEDWMLEEDLDPWPYGDRYGISAGPYPEIDAIQAIPFDELGTYFPFVHFRRDKENMATALLEGTPDYDTSTKLLEYFNMDYQTVTDAIHENPDIGDIEQAMMIMAVSAHDQNEVAMRYLYDHFNALWALGDTTIPWPDQEKIEHEFAQVIQDREFKMVLRHSGLSKRRRAGQIADVGKHQSDQIETTSEQKVFKRSISGQLEELIDAGTGQQLIYRRQVNDTMYDEISIFKPELSYHILGRRTFDAGFGADALVIPVDFALLDGYSLPDREALYARSMHFVFNTRITTRAKWYQTGIFKAVMFVIAVVVMVYTGIEIYSTIAAAAASATAAGTSVLWAVIGSIVQMVATGVVLQEGFQLIVSQIGGDLALVLATVAVVVSLAYGQNGIKALKGAPWAQDLMMAATGLMKAVQVETKDLMDDLREEYETFRLFAEEQTDLLEEAQKLLETSSLINPAEFVGLVPFSIAGESPQDYFNRTVHNANPGVRSLDAISGYVDAALTLPQLSETLRSDFNVANV